jgi:hypothetical protein
MLIIPKKEGEFFLRQYEFANQPTLAKFFDHHKMRNKLGFRQHKQK